MHTANIMDIKRFAIHDGPGIRTTFFLKGCPLRCVWCHNPEGMDPNRELAWYEHKCIHCGECVRICPSGVHAEKDGSHVLIRDRCTACGKCEDVCPAEAIQIFGKTLSAEDAVSVAMRDRVFYETSRGGITVSGGEPLLQADFVRDFFTCLKEKGLHTAVDTCGYVTREAFEKVTDVTDLFLFDIKHIDSGKHQQLTGVGNDLILSNLKWLSDLNCNIEIRFPLVPGLNDDEETLEGIADQLSKLHILRLRILPYHSLARSKYRALGKTDTMPDTEPPDKAALQKVADRMEKKGIKAVSGMD